MLHLYSASRLLELNYCFPQFRIRTRCLTVLVVSDQKSFLNLLADRALRTRLLGWSTKLLVLTQLDYQDLEETISCHWTFIMMNVMFLNMETLDTPTKIK